MKIFVDSDVFIAALTSEPQRGPIARDLLNQSHILCTSLLNLMEVRTVLAKKKQQPQPKVENAINKMRNGLDEVVESPPSLILTNEKQKQTLLYPMDCLFYSKSDEEDAIPISFDRELRHHGAVHPKYLI